MDRRLTFAGHLSTLRSDAESSRVFYLAKHKRALHLNYAVHLGQHVKHEVIELIHISEHYLEQEVKHSARAVTLYHFLQPGYVLLEAIDMLVIMHSKRHIAKRHKRQSDFLIVDQSRVAGNHTIIFKSPDTLIDRSL